MKLPKLKPSVFDLLNVAVAALRDGVSPLYTLYIVTGLGFTPVQVAWVVSASSIAMVLGQIPLGYLFNWVARKRLLLSVGAVGLTGAAVLMAIVERPSVWYVVGVQVFFGASTALLALGIPAITVAETEGDDLGGRMARNEVCAKIGNLTALAVAGGLSRVLPLRHVFFMIPLLALPTIGLVGWGKRDKGHAAPKAKRGSSRWSVRPSRGSIILAAVVFLLFLSETGAITIFEQVFGRDRPGGGASYVAWAIGFGQACVTIGVLGLSRVDKSRGLVASLVAALGLVIGRLFLMASASSVLVLTLAQVMDGMVAAVLFTVPARLLTRLDPKEFNVLSGFQGAAGTCGAMFSTLSTGYLMNHYGYPRALLAYVPVAGLGIVMTLLGARDLVKDRS